MTDEKSSGDGLRLDVWLWAARFFKTRILATNAINSGKIHVGAARPKPSRRIRCGDVLSIRLPHKQMVIGVRSLTSRRKSASEAMALYEIQSETVHRKEERGPYAQTGNPHPKGRPTKQERRHIIAWQRHTD